MYSLETNAYFNIIIYPIRCHKMSFIKDRGDIRHIGASRACIIAHVWVACVSVYDRQQATSAADEVTGDTCVNLEMPLGCQKVRRKEISKAV